MVGTIAQQIALVSHGNEALYTGRIDETFLQNTTFKFCKKVKFIRIRKANFNDKNYGLTVASDPNKWFEHLISEDCKRLKLFYLPPKKSSDFKPYMLAGFTGGGGSWLIEAIYDDHSDYWTSKWKVVDKNAPDKKIWTVILVKIDFNKPSKDAQDDLIAVKQEFNRILQDLSDFTNRTNHTGWNDTFNKAKDALFSMTPNSEYYNKDLLEEKNYSLVAQQLMYTAALSWVFGGMGWWNDIGFNEEKDTQVYNKLTEELFDMICKAIVVSTNSYYLLK